VKKVKIDKKSVVQYADRIAEYGIVVIDGITTMPVLNQPYVSHNYVFGICHCGEVEAEYDTQDVHYCQHEVSIVYPGHPLWIKRVSEDYLATIVVVSAAEYKELSSHVSFRSRFLYEQSPSFLLTDSQYADLMNIIGTMRIVDNSEISSRQQLMESLLDVLLDMTDYFRHQNESQDELAPQRLSSKFYQAIADHHGKSHSVGYYADLFFLSPKYFSDVIKKETGHSAKHWIGAYLIREAKLLLRSRRDLNIQQISDMLGYDDQTSFSRHFKKDTGMSPTKYKRQD
jgi:AraC-like DNA-binding protein